MICFRASEKQQTAFFSLVGHAAATHGMAGPATDRCADTYCDLLPILRASEQQQPAFFPLVGCAAAALLHTSSRPPRRSAPPPQANGVCVSCVLSRAEKPRREGGWMDGCLVGARGEGRGAREGLAVCLCLSFLPLLGRSQLDSLDYGMGLPAVEVAK